jgi:hypothetical protein
MVFTNGQMIGSTDNDPEDHGDFWASSGGMMASNLNSASFSSSKSSEETVP